MSKISRRKSAPPVAGVPDAFMVAVRQLGAALDRFDEAASRALGIGRSDLRALHLLEHGPVTAGELAQRLELTTGTITALVNRLVVAGYLRRIPAADDRRVVVIELDPATYGAIASVYSSCGRSVAAVSHALLDPERQAAADVLHDVADAIEVARANLADD